MAIPLKQSTASQEIPLGFFVDSADGNTEETGLTIANTDIWLWKAGATTLANKNLGGATHIQNGIYYCTLDDTDTNTVGPLIIFVHESGALPVRVECVVLPANVYDSLIGGTDALQVHANEITAGLITAAAIATGAIDADAIADNAIDAGAIAADAITAAKIADAAIDAATFAAGAITAAAVATGAIDADAIADNAIDAGAIAAGAITAAKFAAGAVDAAALATDAVNEIVDQVWNEAQVDHVAAGSFGEIATEIAGILDDTGTAGVVVASIAAGAVTAAAIATGAIDADALATDAVNEIVDQVWNEALADHSAAGSTGEALDTAASGVSADVLWDEPMDANAPAGCNTAREYMNVIVAVLAGKSAGAGDWSARDLGDTKTRVQATLSASGDRSSVDVCDGT